MSISPSATQASRQPFALRELLCLMTLAALLLGLLLRTGWTSQERWLLGLTLGGSLLGIAVARAFQRRGWLIGLIVGVVGGLVTIGIISREWRLQFQERLIQGYSAADLADLRSDHLTAQAVTLGLAVLLALVGVILYLVFAWATDASPRGLVATARRHPSRATAALALVSALVMSILNIDYLLSPSAWAPRHFIPLERIERPMYVGKGLWTVRRGNLSHQGDWLLLEEYLGGISYAEATSEKQMFQLDPRPRVVSFTQRPERAAFVTFSPSGKQILFLEWLGEAYVVDPPRNHRLRIVDLEGQASEVLPEKPRDHDIHSLQWLPSGEIVIHYGDDWNGRKGYTKLARREGKWTRHESTIDTTFHPHAGLALEFPERGLRMVDLASGREIDSFSQAWLAEMMEGLGQHPSAWLHVSPNRRFLLAHGRIFDRETRTTRHWQYEEKFVHQPHFHGFTPRGLAVYDAGRNFAAWQPFHFLTDVPLGGRLLGWLMRERIRLIDPETGLVVASTRPLPDSATSIVHSHDGSRLAIFTDGGVFVYEMPPRR